MISILENTHNFETKTFIDVLVLDRLLSYLKPTLSCELGILRGDTLKVIDYHSEKTHGIDIRFRPQLELHSYKNTTMIHADEKNNTDALYDFIHVDGDHSYNGCYDDLMFCENHSHQQTIIVVDDYLNPKLPGVTKSTDDFIKKSEFNITVKGHNQVFLEKPNQNTVKNIIENHFEPKLRQFCQYDASISTYTDVTGMMLPESKLHMTARILQDATV